MSEKRAPKPFFVHTDRGVRMQAYVSNDKSSVMAGIDNKGNSKRAYWHAYALAPWEARQFALALNAAADHLDPGGSADAPEAK